ncbi:MAG: PilZ domain-containing protein [Candidatus Sedimenticola sp. (ex Thyasira tokunagai)]
MSEQRQYPRKFSSSRVSIFDLGSQEPLGNLGNLSATGLMLITDRELRPGHIFQLEMTLLGEEGEEYTFTFGAESLWVQRISSSEHSWVGLQIIDMAESDTALIERLTQDWKE